MNPIYRVFCRAYQLVFRAALPLLPYREPVELTGLTSIPPLLAQKGITGVLLVTDRGVRSLGLTGPLENALAAQHIACAVYDGVVQNPTIDNVEAGRALYLASDAKAIIAVGGGSAMDCAKAVGARIARPKKSVQRMKGLLRVLHRTPLTIAVPTTAGTGSETTLAAVITDAKARHKYPINDFALIPDYAVLDPQLTAGLPPQLTATTGMDALTHAVEAYIGRSTTKLTRAMAEKAVCLIHDNLLVAYQDGGNMQARANMLEAAYCAGIAFTRSYVGYVQGIAHSLGGQYGIAHGLAQRIVRKVHTTTLSITELLILRTGPCTSNTLAIKCRRCLQCNSRNHIVQITRQIHIQHILTYLSRRHTHRTSCGLFRLWFRLMLHPIYGRLKTLGATKGES